MARRTDDKLGAAITETVIRDYGAAAFLSRLSDPFWFQALGSVMGMDWHSSGITTPAGRWKKGLTPRAHELGLRLWRPRKTFPKHARQELRIDRRSPRTRRRNSGPRQPATARIDNNAIADGFQIYLHSFVVTSDGEWAIVQQGLNDRSGMARRYHWHSASVRDFVVEPHTGIVGENQGVIMNLVDARAKPAQTALLDIARENPEKTLAAARRLADAEPSRSPRENVNEKRLGAVLAVAYERDLHDFAELLLLENSVRDPSVARLSRRSHPRAPSRFSDPARFHSRTAARIGHRSRSP